MNNDATNKRLKIIEDLNSELNKIKEAYTESIENDPKYQKMREATEKLKEENKEVLEKVTSNETMKAMEEEMKKIRDDIKEHKQLLAQEFADYYKDTGTLEFKDNEGDVKRIIFSVKIVNA